MLRVERESRSLNKKSLLLALIVASMSWVQNTSFAHSYPELDWSTERDEKCETLRKTTQILDLYRLTELYYCRDYANASIGDFYKSSLYFAYRIFRVYPEDVENVTTIMWWEWSRSNDYFDILPGDEGKDGLKNALAIGRKAAANPEFSQDVNYNIELAKISLAMGYFWDLKTHTRGVRPELLKFSRDRLMVVENSTEATDFQRVRARLKLGHVARLLGEKQTSKDWFEKALAIAPADRDARYNLAILTSR
jgi:hypothetical protein